MEGRQILDLVLIANKAIDSRMKANLRRVICKLDIKKAYDHANWNFIFVVLERWVLVLSGLVGLAWFLVLVNGFPSGFFQSSMGL